MKFQKGMPRPANAGRKVGSQNKKKVLKVHDFLANKEINPTEEILKLMPFLDPDEQARTWLHLLSYCQAKPALEVEDENSGNDSTDIIEEFKKVSDEALILIAGGKKDVS